VGVAGVSFVILASSASAVSYVRPSARASSASVGTSSPENAFDKIACGLWELLGTGGRDSDAALANEQRDLFQQVLCL
jgi:hypothetical protein